MAERVNPNAEDSENVESTEAAEDTVGTASTPGTVDIVDTVDSTDTAETTADESPQEEETPDTEESADPVDSAEDDPDPTEIDGGQDTAENTDTSDTADPMGVPESSAMVATTLWGWHRKVLVAAIVLLLGATGFAGWAGWSWSRAVTDDSLRYAQARDAALEDGRENLAVLSSLDHRRVDEGLQRWLEVSTGPLHKRLADTSAEVKTTLREGRTVANGAVLEAGITELDEYGGTATMLAAVEILLSEEDTAPATRRNRFTVGLTRTEEGWKLSSLNQLPLDID